MANVKYNTFGRAIAKNDLDTVSFKVMFCNVAYTPNPDTEVFLSDIVANRASGTTDIAVTLSSINVDNTDNRTEFVFSNPVTGTITATTNAVVLYIDTGVAATSELLTYNELTSGGVQTNFSVIDGVLTTTVSANGLFSI